jgi:type IV fimbrial biogenesis protein FimT
MNSRLIAQCGVTIIELMIVVAIGAILAVIAIPSLRDTLNNTRQSTALGLIINDLNQARGEAIKRNARILVCGANAAGTNCIGGLAPTDWRAGWLVCREGTVAGECAASDVQDPNPVIVRPPINDSLTLVASAAVIRFNPNSSAMAATLTLGGTWSGATNRVATVAVTGNISK